MMETTINGHENDYNDDGTTIMTMIMIMMRREERWGKVYCIPKNMPSSEVVANFLQYHIN
jgi:hypothetical protein